MDNVAQLETDTNFQSRKKITWGVFSVLLLFLVAGILYYFFVYRFYQSTDNAYVQADVTWVMPKISGEVMELLINDNQFVKKGETLAVLDHRDYQARYDQARSVVSLKEAALGVQQQNEKSARSSIIEANSGVVAAQADLVRLKKEFERYQDLLKDGVITRQILKDPVSIFNGSGTAQQSASRRKCSRSSVGEFTSQSSAAFSRYSKCQCKLKPVSGRFGFIKSG